VPIRPRSPRPPPTAALHGAALRAASLRVAPQRNDSAPVAFATSADYLLLMTTDHCHGISRPIGSFVAHLRPSGVTAATADATGRKNSQRDACGIEQQFLHRQMQASQPREAAKNS
jgi:hypothetical protein